MIIHGGGDQGKVARFQQAIADSQAALGEDEGEVLPGAACVGRLLDMTDLEVFTIDQGAIVRGRLQGRLVICEVDGTE